MRKVPHMIIARKKIMCAKSCEFCEVVLRSVTLPNKACSGLGGGLRKKQSPSESIFPFRRLVLPPSR